MDDQSTSEEVRPIIPTGTLRELDLSEIQPSDDNPRVLFDPEPLATLKDNIRTHGVLVPLTVHLPAGATVYKILDGARRYRCCLDLAEEGFRMKVKANIIDTPDKLAGLLAMFSIHNFREGWELMPTALSLKDVMEGIDEEEADNKRLRELTGLSEPQIERCRILMTLPERFQLLSLDPDPITRIPSNFWIEAFPVVGEIESRLPQVALDLLGRDGVFDQLVAKYRAKSIRSVIHFRRVMEAFTLLNDTDEDFEEKTERAETRLKEWLLEVNYETRAAFDPLVADEKRIQKAVDMCSSFARDLKRLKLDYTTDREGLRRALLDVQDYVASLLEKLKGEDEPVTLFDDEDGQ